MKLSVPKGESPVSTGVVPGSQASGKVANREVRTEVSRTAVSVLTPYRVRGRLNRNYIRRPSGRMRYHMLPKSKILERGQYRNGRCSGHKHKDTCLQAGAKAPFGGPEQVIKYLGRYTHKSAITHYRIQKIANGYVQFSYKDYADGNKTKSMALGEREFLRRFEQHILPRRFVRIRHYGFLTNRGKKERLKQLRKDMGLEEMPPILEIPVAVRMLERFGRDITQCQECLIGKYELLFTKRFGKTTYRKPLEIPEALQKLKI